MANLFASGTTWNLASNWGLTSGASDGTVPTATDDVKFDANSVSMAIDVNATCLSMDTTGFTATLTQNATRTLTIGSGNLNWVAGTFAGGDSTIDINGTFALSGGTFTSTTATMFVLSTFTISGAPTFSANGGTIRVGESGSMTFTSNGETFFNLEFFKTAGGTSIITLADDFTIASGGELKMDKTDDSTFTVTPSGTRTITLKGDFTISDTSNSPTVTFGNAFLTLVTDGTADQTFTYNDNRIRMGAAVTINKASGTFILGSDFGFGGNFTRTAGTVNQAGFTFIFTCVADGTLTTNGLTFVDLRFDKISGPGSTLTLVDDFTVTGNLVVDKRDTSSFAISPSGIRTITLQGNFTIQDTSGSPQNTFGTNSLTLLVNGTGTQTFTRSGTFSNSRFNAVIDINKASGSFTLGSDFAFLASFTRTAGTVNQAGFTISFGATLNSTLTTNGLSFVDLEFSKQAGGTSTLTLADDFTVTGNLTVDKTDPSSFTISPSGTRTITLQSNFSMLDTSASPDLIFGTINLTLLLSDTSAQTVSQTAGKFNSNLTINKSSGTVSLASAFTLLATGTDFTITSGTFDFNGFDLTVDDILTISSGVTIQLKGNETITTGSTSLPASWTAIYKDSAVTATLNNLATAFNNLTLGASKTHNITASTTITLDGTFASNGTSSTRSLLRSSVAATTWLFNFTGTSSLTDEVDVKDSDASSGNEVSAIGSTDSGNNTKWKFVEVSIVSHERGTERGILRGVLEGI